MGGHTLWPYFLNYTFSNKYFTMNEIHDIPETNGYDSQHLDRALKSHFLKKYHFLTYLNSAEKM